MVEIASYTEHLLNECDVMKGKLSACPKCGEALPAAEVELHVSGQAGAACSSSGPAQAHCPLCHENFAPATEDSWRTHLMAAEPEGCRQNPRRLLSLQRGIKPGPLPGGAGQPGSGTATSSLGSRAHLGRFTAGGSTPTKALPRK